MDIGDLLIAQQQSLFVGREQELAIFKQQMSAPQWRLLHIHGSGGIGKTTLLRLFAQSVGPERGIYFDGHSDFQSSQDFLAQIRRSLPIAVQTSEASDILEESDILNDYAAAHGGIVLLLDTFEKWGTIEDWLRREWFPKLSPLVKICSAGRYPLEDQWIRNGWHALIENVQLQPFSSDEIQLYANTRGINNELTITSLQRFSSGLPLALSMACEIILRRGNEHFLGQQQKDHIITYLIEELTRDIEESYLQCYIEAASMIWRFDQELLQSILQQDITHEHFREFCRLPFVIRQADRWSLHDTIRQWVFTDIRSRMPQTFQLYRKRALTALFEREAMFPHKKTEYAYERLYLHELDFVRDFCFQWDDRLRFRECRPHELELVEQLYLSYLHHQSNFMSGEVHMESLIRPLWHIDPSAFYSLWRDDEIVAFCSCILLTEQTVEIFRTNPITEPAMTRFNPNHRQYLLCLTGVTPHLERDITGSLARALLQIIERYKDADFLNLISVSYWLEFLPLLGFERIPWADSSTPLGVQYTGHHLDLRYEDLPSLLSRMHSTIETSLVAEQRTAATAAATSTQKKTLPLEEAIQLVKYALKQFSRLPLYPELVHTLQPLFPTASYGIGTKEFAVFIQNNIRDIVQTFLDGGEEEQRCYRILQHAYIKKIGTHEIVSEHLNIPIKSYYRYLQTAVRLLAYKILQEN